VGFRLHEILASGLLLAVPLGAIALNCTSTATSVPGCDDLCVSQLPCWPTLADGGGYAACQAACNSVFNMCNKSGHPSAFAAYAVCAGDAGFTCVDGGAIANAPCGTQENMLDECLLEIDGGFNVPDSALANDMGCVGSNCIPCCQMHHPDGSKIFVAAVEACECGDAGQCQGPCQGECATHFASRDAGPVATDPCDQCLTNSLDDQEQDAGTCVLPVTAACNKNLDCALYVNCATQIGCSP
jgi:hypothetical protein